MTRAALPDFPWDALAPLADRARAYPEGLIDLSVGTPVDPTPDVIARALAEHANAPGYPVTTGLPELRSTLGEWSRRVLGARADLDVLPTIGSKEAVAALPGLLGVDSSSTVVIPRIAYPTYEVGALVAGASVVPTDDVENVAHASIVWLNSPSNPTGAVLTADRMKSIVEHARSIGAVVISDECYFELGWEEQPVSILHPTVIGDDATGVIAVHSLSKRSNLAGYRFGFLAGDPALIAQLLGLRKHMGMMVPTPVQHAAIAAYSDSDHVQVQRERYASRRAQLRDALHAQGFRIDDSVAGLYLWATRDEDSWQTVRWFAERGVLVTPGTFYGTAGDQHVRVALTATDEHVRQAVQRITA